ncbi:hypothetical protein AA313_de0202648 [Arthrobotrys entomopaga]|nr:hypothetical protein AA313_de0202648 [Arthrobotrys entomopaga]
MASAALESIAEVVLTPSGSLADSVGPRTIRITPSQPLVTVGRSSRNKTKNLLPDSDNAYFDSPVMSRLHAWIKCDEEGKVVISDASSMHGTYINDRILEPKRFVPLESGSTVKFGSSVSRGSETFPPKVFGVKIIQTSRMAEVHHGYGITSDELVLPDSPYSSDEEEEEEEEEEDDDIMITEVKAINKSNSQPRYWDESNPWEEEREKSSSRWTGWRPDPPSEVPITIVRESLRNSVESPSIIRNTTHVDLTVDSHTSQPNRPSVPRMSINELIQSQSRQHSKTPVREGAASRPVMLDSDLEDYDDIDAEYDEDDTGSSHEGNSSGSVPTSTVTEDSSDLSKKSFPLPDIQSPTTATGNSGLEHPPILEELVSPEIKQAWDNTWKAPLVSPFGYNSCTTSADPDSMEQVRKAEAMRDRATSFLRSRIEMQGSRPFYTPSKEKDNLPYPTPTSTNQIQAKADSSIPFWVRNFASNVGGNSEKETDNGAGEVEAAESPCDGRGDPDAGAPLSPAETRSPSPEIKMAGRFEISDEEDWEDESWVQKDPDCESTSEASSYEQSALSSDEDEDMAESFSLEISSVEEDPMDDARSESEEPGYDDRENFVDDYQIGFINDTEDEASSNDGGDREELIDTLSPISVEKVAENILVHNAVKNAMSMENFFSPNDDTSDSFDTEPQDKAPWAAIAKKLEEVFEENEERESADIPLLDVESPVASKKRKRSESEEPEECSRMETDLDDGVPAFMVNRKIAPLPRRFVAPTKHQLAVPISAPASLPVEADRQELLALADELKNELEAESSEPKVKRPRVQNAGAGWGSTLATAIAGALVGGVGVFAALVATAGDL